MDCMQLMLAQLRAMSDHYQECHWRAAGLSAYQDHLLFERLYGNIPEEVDQLAEKLLGYGKSIGTPQEYQWRDQTRQAWARASSDLVGRSVFAEKMFVRLCDRTRDRLERKGQLTVGIEDLIGSIASQHETHLYLLNQRSS